MSMKEILINVLAPSTALRFLLAWACVIAFQVPTNVFAQSAKVPVSTVGSFGSWATRCIQPKPGKAGETESLETSAAKACEMITTIRVNVPAKKDAAGKVIPAKAINLAKIFVGRPVGKENVKVLFHMPIGVWLRTPVSLKFSATEDGLNKVGEGEILRANYFACNAEVCLADLLASEAQIKALAKNKFAQLSFVDSTRHLLKVRVSTNGFAEAYNAILN